MQKGGSKLKENTDVLESTRPGDSRLPPDKDGFPQFPPGKSGLSGNLVNGIMRLTARGQRLSALIFPLSTQLGTMTGQNTFAAARIVDKTGLTGKYDFHIEYAGDFSPGSALSLPVGPDGAPTGGLTLPDAMEKQLGIKVTRSTAPYDVLMIDHVEKIPTEN